MTLHLAQFTPDTPSYWLLIVAIVAAFSILGAVIDYLRARHAAQSLAAHRKNTAQGKIMGR